MSYISNYTGAQIDAAIAVINGAKFLVRPSVQQSDIAVGELVTVVFGTKIKDVGNNFASNTFTAPATGMYQFSFSVGLEEVDTASAFYQVLLVTTNRTYEFMYQSGVEASADPTWVSISGAVLADMNSGDTAVLKVLQWNGTQQTDIVIRTFFSGHFVG